MNYIYLILGIIFLLIILRFIVKLSIKIFAVIFLIIAIIATLTIIFVQPKMHKEFNFNIIQRVLKFNDDGSASIIETTTTNEVQKK